MACLHKNKLWDSRWCPVTCFYCTGEQERTCKHNKVTNADRIRAMTDEELAGFLVSVENRRRGNDCGAVWHLPYVALEWLQQPAEGE